jgi:hypothetical protein
MKTLDSKKKSRFERVEPGLFRDKPSGSYYTVLKKDGKTKWRKVVVSLRFSQNDPGWTS